MSLRRLHHEQPAVAVSASVATITFVIASITSRRETRSEELREWQKVVIAELFQSKASGELTFDEILRSYQAEANEYSSVKLRSGDLSRQTLRRILVELIRGRVLDQVTGDKYRLNTMDLFHKSADASLEKYMTQSREMIGAIMPKTDELGDKLFGALGNMVDKFDRNNDDASSVLAEIVNNVHDNPGAYRSAELILHITQDTKISPALIKMQCNLAIASGLLVEDEAGFLRPPAKRIEGSA